MIVIESCLLLICAFGAAGHACFRRHRHKDRCRSTQKKSRQDLSRPIPKLTDERTSAVTGAPIQSHEKKKTRILGCPAPGLEQVPRSPWLVPSPLAHLVKLAPEEIVSAIIAKTILSRAGRKEQHQFPPLSSYIAYASTNRVGHLIDPKIITQVVWTMGRKKGNRFTNKPKRSALPEKERLNSPSTTTTLLEKEGNILSRKIVVTPSSAIARMPTHRSKSWSAIRINPSIKKGLKRVRKLSRVGRRLRRRDSKRMPVQTAGTEL